MATNVIVNLIFMRAVCAVLTMWLLPYVCTYVMAYMYLMCQYDTLYIIMLQQESTIASSFAVVVVGSVSISLLLFLCSLFYAFLCPHCYYLFRFSSVPCLCRVLIAAEIAILCHDKLAAHIHTHKRNLFDFSTS